VRDREVKKKGVSTALKTTVKEISRNEKERKESGNFWVREGKRGDMGGEFRYVH